MYFDLWRYTFNSIESQIRVLGDYAFMLRDYELALSNYRLLSTDYKLDKAWKQYAGVQVLKYLLLLWCLCIIVLLLYSHPVEVFQSLWGYLVGILYALQSYILMFLFVHAIVHLLHIWNLPCLCRFPKLININIFMLIMHRIVPILFFHSQVSLVLK